MIANSFRPSNAQEVIIGANLGIGSVQLTDTPCSVSDPSQPAYDLANSTLNINILTNAVASNCLGISVISTNELGYSMTIQGPSTGNLTLANQVITNTTGTITTPAIFSNSIDTSNWGFAIPSSQVQ
ncbi:hypothetical protein FWG86_02755, partial [Candidatus Saccharibacteria bacterium]|nr:hypothetical protein [Candidatus Saccharibacteria bacterium]